MVGADGNVENVHVLEASRGEQGCAHEAPVSVWCSRLFVRCGVVGRLLGVVWLIVC